MSNTETLRRFVERNSGSVKLDGLFWCESPKDYRCVVLAKGRKRTVAAEFDGAGPGELVKAAAGAHVDLGTPTQVGKLCRAAPRSKLTWSQMLARYVA